MQGTLQETDHMDIVIDLDEVDPVYASQFMSSATH